MDSPQNKYPYPFPRTLQYNITLPYYIGGECNVILQIHYVTLHVMFT